MGQAWCKEKTNKAQDSKSPLDRVFVRCAHRIYPSLKEEGSVLGGATQRVTSSEIGYAGSPPRDVLTRGRSIDSVDRPFHPSEWVDVNLEVPSTPRASSVLTNLTVDTSLYPATTPTSSCSNLKDVTPVPPPRRRKKNRGRPLPPKPDEIPENGSNLKRVDTSEEPLYSSVKSPKSDNENVVEVEGKEQQQQQQQKQEQGQQQPEKGKTSTHDEDLKQEGRRTKEIYEHKVNGTGRIIPRDVVSGNKRPHGPERKSSRNGQSSAAASPIRKVPEDDEEYERFARSQSIKDSSTPNRREGRKSGEFDKRVNDNPAADAQRPEVSGRPKNYSTVSLPNYDELEVARHRQRGQKGPQSDEDRKPRRPVRSSTGSLPVESILSPFSQKTSVLLEDYVPRRGSSENLLPYQVLGKLGRSKNGVDDGGFVKYDPSKLEDWDLSDIGNCELNNRQCSFEDAAPRIIGEKLAKDRRSTESEDVVDFSSKDIETGENEASRRQASSSNIDAGSVQQASPSLQKPVAFGKSLAEQDEGVVSEDVDEWVVGQHRSLRYFDPPTLADCNCSPDSASSGAVSREPFFLNEDAQAKANDTIGGSCRNGAVEESERPPELLTSRTIFERSLSNESEPYEDSYESKDLRGRSSPITGNLIRTISEESLPREILDEVEIVDRMTVDDFFDEKLAKDAHNKLTKDAADQKVIVKTPPPSPEPKIKAEILDNDHSTLLKVLKEEAHEGSNLSSMTPSLTELEAALSDMLEKEEPPEEVKDDDVSKRASISPSSERPIEPSILPTDKSGFLKKVDEAIDSDRNLVDEIEKTKMPDKLPISLEQILEDVKPVAKARKVSFCAWEENVMEEVDLRNGQDGDGFDDGSGEEFLARDSSADKVAGSKGGLLTDEAPEKPSRLHRSNMESSTEIIAENIPTPPRRRHKNVGKESFQGHEAKDTDPYSTDRLI